MQGQLSQRTLGVLRRILEDMPRYIDTEGEIELKRFWKDTLFDEHCNVCSARWARLHP